MKRIADRHASINRRSLLASAAGFAATLTPHWAMAAPEISPVMAKLSAYMSEARNRALPDEVTEHAKRHILDTFAAMISGSDLPPGRFALGFARVNSGDRTATIAGTDTLCGPIEAALINALLAHADETDDSHAFSLSHPGSSIVPATLAAAERFGAAGTHFLRAVALGYDIGTRVNMTLGPKFRDERRMSTHNFAGTFGASAAAGCIAGLNGDQMRWLIDYAAQQAGGLNATLRDTGHIEKGFVFAGSAARNGITGALLVHAGATGVEDILSGPGNFLRTHSPEAKPEGLIDKLGERYEVARTGIKKWSVGSPIQAPLDALDTILKRRRFDTGDVRKVVVRSPTSEAATTNNRDIPDICMQHMIAVMLIDRTASFRAAHDEPRMHDPAVLAQRAKVELVPDDELERRRPSREAIVEVTLMDGTQLSEHVTGVRGTAENPMTREEVVAKARDLIAPILGEAKAGKLIEVVFALEAVKDIHELRPLLQRA